MGDGASRNRAFALLLVSGVAALIASPSAGAATQLGQTFPPPSQCSGQTYLQSSSDNSAYAAPTAGVITSWRFLAGPTSPASGLRLKVGRTQGGNVFTIVGESQTEPIAPSQLNSFPTRIPVLAGDVIGFFHSSAANSCNGSAMGAHGIHMAPGDVAAGTTATFTPDTQFQLDLAATLEPDADNDGFGDESQDCNTASAAQTNDCAPPETQVTKGPKAKAKKRKATFEFSGTDARVVASFECSLNGAPFGACASPITVKGKKGKNSFSVRAVDAAGNADGTPATQDWKVKKKRKKRKK